MRGWAPEHNTTHMPQLVEARVYTVGDGWFKSEAMLYEVANSVTLNIVYSRDKLLLRLQQNFILKGAHEGENDAGFFEQYSHCCGSLLKAAHGGPNAPDVCSTCLLEEPYMQVGRRRSVLLKAKGAFEEVTAWCEPHASNTLDATLWAYELYGMSKEIAEAIMELYSVE